MSHHLLPLLLAALALALVACDDTPASSSQPATVTCANPSGRPGDQVRVGRKVYACHRDGYWREQ